MRLLPTIEEDFDEQYEEYCRRYEEEEEDLEHSEEEGYEEPSCSASGRGSRNDVDAFRLSAYDQTLWQKSTSIHGQMFNGRNSKKPFQYSMEYCALKEEIREVLYFRDFCTLEI